MSDAALNPGHGPFRYDPLTITLHWLTFLLVALLWLSAQVIDVFPRDGGRVEARSVHILLGVTLLGVLLVRLGWRKTPWGGRRPPRRGPGDLAALGLQVLMLLLLGGTILLGLFNAAVHGAAVFTWVKLPPLAPGYPDLPDMVTGWHGFGANLILAVVGVHAAAALGHHYVLRDCTLRRMLPFGRVTCGKHDHRAAPAQGD
jgi:cytochrome b561